jgi:hypothetical protein
MTIKEVITELKKYNENVRVMISYEGIIDDISSINSGEEILDGKTIKIAVIEGVE